jgi:hypothetical protein
MSKEEAEVDAATASTTTTTTNTPVENATVEKASSSSPPPSKDVSTSALADNIARKGKNAYYFAHAHKANGPKWDGKAEPRLLQKEALQDSYRQSVKSSFDYTASNITSYAFLDETKKVKLYIDLEDVGNKCTEDDIRLDYSERSMSLVILNYKDEPQSLSFSKLSGGITKATYKLKENKIILTLFKVEEQPWHTINDKGEPDHEVV